MMETKLENVNVNVKGEGVESRINNILNSIINSENNSVNKYNYEMNLLNGILQKSKYESLASKFGYIYEMYRAGDIFTSKKELDYQLRYLIN